MHLFFFTVILSKIFNHSVHLKIPLLSPSQGLCKGKLSETAEIIASGLPPFLSNHTPLKCIYSINLTKDRGFPNYMGSISREPLAPHCLNHKERMEKLSFRPFPLTPVSLVADSGLENVSPEMKVPHLGINSS